MTTANIQCLKSETMTLILLYEIETNVSAEDVRLEYDITTKNNVMCIVSVQLTMEKKNQYHLLVIKIRKRH